MNAPEHELLALIAALESGAEPAALDRAAARVDERLARLSTATPRAELERVASLHACAREIATRRRDQVRAALATTQSARARLEPLTRPSEGPSNLDLSV